MTTTPSMLDPCCDFCGSPLRWLFAAVLTCGRLDCPGRTEPAPYMSRDISGQVPRARSDVIVERIPGARRR
jgi:hypothetical protein